MIEKISSLYSLLFFMYSELPPFLEPSGALQLSVGEQLGVVRSLAPVNTSLHGQRLPALPEVLKIVYLWVDMHSKFYFSF